MAKITHGIDPALIEDPVERKFWQIVKNNFRETDRVFAGAVEAGNDPGAVAVSDHGLLDGLGDDDHSQYLLLAGRASGQILQKTTTDSANDVAFIIRSAHPAGTPQGLLAFLHSDDTYMAQLGVTNSTGISIDGPALTLGRTDGGYIPLIISVKAGGGAATFLMPGGIGYAMSFTDKHLWYDFAASGSFGAYVQTKRVSKLDSTGNAALFTAYGHGNELHLTSRLSAYPIALGGSQFLFTTQFGGTLTYGTLPGAFVLDHNSGSTADPVLVVKGIASLTGDLQQWRNSAGTVLAKVDKDGDITAPTFTATTTPGFSGDGSGLTAVPVVAHALLSASHSDTLTQTVQEGDLIGANATPKWSRLPIGTAGYYLRSSGTQPGWQPIYEEDVDRNVASVFGRVHQAETVDAEWTFPGNGASRSIIIDSSDTGGGTDDGLGLFITDTTISGFGVKLCANDTMATDIVVKLPAASGTVISNTETITVTNKRLGTGTVLRCGSSGPPDTAGCLFGKGTSTTTGFRFDLSAITTSTIRDKTVQDKSGTDPVIVAPSSATTNKTGQTGSIAATTAYATGTPGAGLYRADVYGVVTARTTTGDIKVDILYTDPAAAQTVVIPTINTIAMGAAVGQNFQGSLVFYANASTNIQFQTTHTGTYTYSLWVRVTALT